MMFDAIFVLIYLWAGEIQKAIVNYLTILFEQAGYFPKCQNIIVIQYTSANKHYIEYCELKKVNKWSKYLILHKLRNWAELENS